MKYNYNLQDLKYSLHSLPSWGQRTYKMNKGPAVSSSNRLTQLRFMSTKQTNGYNNDQSSPNTPFIKTEFIASGLYLKNLTFMDKVLAGGIVSSIFALGNYYTIKRP